MEKIIKFQKVYKYKMVSNEPIIYSEAFVKIRSKARNKLSKCFHCNKAHKLYSNIYILFIENNLNKTVCEACAALIKKQLCLTK